MKGSESPVVGSAAAVLIVASLVASSALFAQESAPATGEDGVVAFYFHGNVRCATCRKIEAYADESIHSGFADALEAGSLIWSVVNVDEPENKHFIEDFQLVTRSVVLAEYQDGEVLRWKKLDKVWQLVRDKEGFTSYVQSETREFLGEGQPALLTGFRSEG
jgi:hypothetical protein